jgi:phospholipid/cholesterol/gamma-HCH transport system substrate-binding protein
VKLQTEVERKLGGSMAPSSRAFLWFAVAGMIAVLGALAYSQRWFTPTLGLYFYTDTATGLSRGMAVKLVGFNVGTLEQVSLVGELSVKGRLVMDRRYRDSVGKDARIRLARDGLLGTYILQLIPGPGDPGPVDDGNILTFERELDYGAMAANLLERAGPVIDDLRIVTAKLVDAEAGVPEALKQLRDAAVALRVMGESVSTLAADGSRLTREVPARIEPALKEIERNLAQIHALTKQVNEALPPMLEDARSSLRSAKQATDAAQRVIADDVPRVLRRTEELLEDTEEIIGGVRRSWPVKNMLPPPGGTIIELDSADGAGKAAARKPAP